MEIRNLGQKPVKVYVGSIPADASETELRSYFARFGNVVKVDLFYDRAKQKEEKGDPRLNQGYCHVIVGGQQMADTIIQYSNHIFQERKIYCRSYVKGGHLRECNADNNRRRVIIKNLPASILDEELKQIFESFGKVVAAYFFNVKPSDFIAEQAPKGGRTANIQFQLAESADSLLEIRNLQIHGVHVKACRYEKNHTSKPRLEQNSGFVKFKSKPSIINLPTTRQKHYKWISGQYESPENRREFTFESSRYNSNLFLIKPTSREYFRDNYCIFGRESTNLHFRLLPPKQ